VELPDISTPKSLAGLSACIIIFSNAINTCLKSIAATGHFYHICVDTNGQNWLLNYTSLGLTNYEPGEVLCQM
jgi:hypothetical protein